jgi:hypothetical protein
MSPASCEMIAFCLAYFAALVSLRFSKIAGRRIAEQVARRSKRLAEQNHQMFSFALCWSSTATTVQG